MHISKLLKIMSNKDFTLLKKQIKQEAERRKEALQLLQTDVSSCNCKIPEPIGKCSENGVVSYCKKCLKNYSN